MKRILWLVLIQTCVAGCAQRTAREIDNERAERLAMEKGRLSELTNPVEIARSQIKISRMLLEFAASGLERQELDGMNRRIAQYTTSIQAAHNAMSGSGRDPLQKPAGYRDLETATREFTRTLEGMRSGLGTDQQAEVDNAREITNSIHSEILRLLTAGLPASSR